MKTIADALGVARSNLMAQAATAAPPWTAPAARARVADRDRQVIAGQPTHGYVRVHAPIRGHREQQGGTAIDVTRLPVMNVHGILPKTTADP